MDDTFIIGLGNPDPALEETYHNVGTLAVQWIAERTANVCGEPEPRFRAHYETFAYAKIGDAVFVRPLLFMNESGQAVKDAMRAFGAGPKDIVVIHDDSDIPVGEFKRADGGGSAGHKGIQSIIDRLGTEEFRRIRIGIREMGDIRRKKAGDFVLSPISALDKKIFEGEVFERIFDSLSLEPR